MRSSAQIYISPPNALCNTTSALEFSTMHCAVTAQPLRAAQKQNFSPRARPVKFMRISRWLFSRCQLELIVLWFCLWRGCVIQNYHNIINTTYATNNLEGLRSMKNVKLYEGSNVPSMYKSCNAPTKNATLKPTNQFNAAMVVCQSVSISLNANNVLTTMC